jgi:hypothetical protein
MDALGDLSGATLAFHYVHSHNDFGPILVAHIKVSMDGSG